MKIRAFLFFLMLQSVLASCSRQNDAAAFVVEDYLSSLVKEDATEISNLVCREFEQQAKLELDSFIGVSASLSDLSCEILSIEESLALVTCTGKIIATYNNEQQELDIAGRTYKVQKENSDWLVCGYQ
jgi:hypothetical protein